MSLERYPASAVVASTPSLFLVEEITHRVLNEYTEALCALDLAAAAAADPGSVRAIAEAATRLQALAAAHRALQVPIGHGAHDLGDYVERICKRLADALLSVRGLRMTVSAEAVSLEPARCWRVGLIIAELVRNAVKHGFARHRGGGEIRVDVSLGLEQVRCRVRDNGHAGQGGGEGRGRRLIEAIAADLDGSVTWTFSDSGCCAGLEFPVTPKPRPVAQGIIDADAA